MDGAVASIYGLADSETGEVRYIGKANDPEARLKSHMRDSRRRDTPVYRWIRKHGRPNLVILVDGCADWKADESRMIAEARARGDRLLNVADGGDEPLCSTEVRAANGRKVAALRVSTPDKKRLYELKRSLGQSLKDGFVSDVTRGKMRELAKLHPHMFGCWTNV